METAFGQWLTPVEGGGPSDGLCFSATFDAAGFRDVRRRWFPRRSTPLVSATFDAAAFPRDVRRRAV
jgi:hypothetical protein